MNNPHTNSTDRNLGHTPESLPEQLQEEVDTLLEALLAEANERGERHVNAILGNRPDNHPTRLILEELVGRLQDELGHGPMERPAPGDTLPESSPIS